MYKILSKEEHVLKGGLHDNLQSYTCTPRATEKCVAMIFFLLSLFKDGFFVQVGLQKISYHNFLTFS